jgi:hypothetical protein
MLFQIIIIIYNDNFTSLLFCIYIMFMHKLLYISEAYHANLVK